MPLGDSITAGYCPGSEYQFGGYRMYLANLLEENGLSEQFDFVGKWNTGTGYDMDNNGTNGVMISNDDWGDIIKKDVTTNKILETYQPDMILLQIGTNDILGQSEKKELREFSKINERLEDLINVIFENAKENTVIFLASIPFMEGSSYEQYNTNINEYNLYIKRLVKNHQALQQKIYFVDINSAVSPGQYVDGVHPNQDGYAQMGSLWYKTLTNFLYDYDAFVEDQEKLLYIPEPTGTPTTIPTVTPTIQPTRQPALPSKAPAPKPSNSPAIQDRPKNGTRYTQNGLTYKITTTGKKSTAQVIKATAAIKKKKSIKIPSKILIGQSTFAVTCIGKNVFKNARIKKITLGKNIQTIEKGAFVNCSKLKQIQFQGSSWKTSVSKIGTRTTGVKFIIPREAKKRYKALIKKSGFTKYKIKYYHTKKE